MVTLVKKPYFTNSLSCDLKAKFSKYLGAFSNFTDDITGCRID